MSSHTPLPRQHRKAFSLIEAAIVLGVVGLVIGGIWTAAAVVNDNIRQRQTADGWGYYVSYIGQTYQKSLTAKLTMGADIDLIMGPTVPLPAGWSLTSNRPTDPYGNKLYMSIQPGGQVFTIGYMWQTVGDSACRVAFDFIISRVIDNTNHHK